MKTKSLILFMLLSVALFSCRKDNPNPGNDDNQIESIEDLQVPTDFNWETTSNYTFNITTKTSGVIEIRSIGGKIYHKAFVVNSSNTYSVNLTLPSYLETIQIVQYGTISEHDLVGSVINCQLE